MRTQLAQFDEPIQVGRAARALGVPAHWLRAEIEAGRLPGLRAGRTIIVHVPTIAKRIAARAAEGGRDAR